MVSKIKKAMIYLVMFLKIGLTGCCKDNPLYLNSSSELNGVIVCDIVAVFDSKLAQQIRKMDNVEYFKNSGSLAKLHNDQIKVWRIEQSMKNIHIMIEKTGKPLCLMIFADYRQPGQKIEMPLATKAVSINFTTEGMIVKKDIVNSGGKRIKLLPSLPASTNLSK